MEPALTAEEWADLLAGKRAAPAYERLTYIGCPYSEDFCIDGTYAGRDRQAIAALCLYDEPFGFTHADVELLRSLDLTLVLEVGGRRWEKWPGDGRVRNLADRIAALLPPREETRG